MILGEGCKTCKAIERCTTLTYRGSKCKATRAKCGMGDPFTNFDAIHAMNVEELAEWLEEHCFQYGWLDWLRQEVDDGANAY